MKKLILIPLLLIGVLVYGQTDQPKQEAVIHSEATLSNKIVEIDPILPGEEKVLWKLMDNGKAHSLYEKKVTHWKIKDNYLHIGKKRYHLRENLIVLLE